MTTLFCWERDCLSVLKVKVTIKLNSLRSFLNIPVEYVLTSLLAEDDLSNNTQKEQDSFSELPFFSTENSRHSRLLVVETFI